MIARADSYQENALAKTKSSTKRLESAFARLVIARRTSSGTSTIANAFACTTNSASLLRIKFLCGTAKVALANASHRHVTRTTLGMSILAAASALQETTAQT